MIDFTEYHYYSHREDDTIKGTMRQKGTRKMRHYFGFSILSRGVHIFASLEQVAGGELKIPIIVNFLQQLFKLGFKLNLVLIDHKFYQVALIKRIKEMGGNMLIPIKNYKKVRGMLEECLIGNGNRVRKHVVSSAPGAKQHFSQDAYLIIIPNIVFQLPALRKIFQAEKSP